MEVKKRSQLISVILIIAVAFTMLFVDCGTASAETTRGKVKAIKYVYPSTVTYEENTNGQWSLDINGQLYYRYWAHEAEPEVFTVEYENGEEVTYSNAFGKGDAFYSEHCYRTEDGEIIKLYNCVKSNQNQKHFKLGGDNYFTFQFGDASIKIPVTITKSQTEKTVQKIEYTPAVNEIDYSQCVMTYNGEKEKMQLFFYNNYSHNAGDKLTVTDKSGSTKVYTYQPGKIETQGDDEIWVDAKFVTEDNSEISPADVTFWDDQDLNEWGNGKENYFLVEYGGAVTKVQISIKKNDVESISIHVGEDSETPALSCDENVHYDGTDDSGMIVIDGIVVHKTDGTSEKVVYKRGNWIKVEGLEGGGYYEQEGYFDEKGNEVELSIKHQKMEDSGQWYVYYHGVSCEIPTSHYNASWKIKEKPTCSKAGVYEKKCICGEVVETKAIEIDKDAHKFTKYGYNNDAKVGVDGTETAECDYGCGATDTRTKTGTALGNNGSSFGGGGYVPPIVTTQKPEISSGDGYDVTLSKDGTAAEITVKEGYEIMAVVVNGVFKGKVTRIENLKPADKVFIVVAERSASVSPSDNERIIKGVQNTKIWITKTSSGKGWIRVNYKKSKGFKIDYYEVYRKTGKNGKFGTEPFYTTKSNGLTGSYKNTKSLKKGSRYYYKIRGVRIIEGKAYYTQWSKTYYRIAK